MRVINENELRVFSENEAHVASVVKMRESMIVDLMNVGNGLMNNNARMNVDNNMRVLSENRRVRGANVQVLQADVTLCRRRLPGRGRLAGEAHSIL